MRPFMASGDIEHFQFHSTVLGQGEADGGSRIEGIRQNLQGFPVGESLQK